MHKTMLKTLSTPYTRLQSVVSKASYRQKLFALIGALFVSYGIAFMPQTVAFSHSDGNCYARPTLLPGVFESRGDTFEAQHYGGLKIGSVHVMSNYACIQPVESPQKDSRSSVTSGPFGLPLFQHLFVVQVDEIPTLASDRIPAEIAVSRSLVVPLTTSDRVHEYKLNTSDVHAECIAATSGGVECDVPALALEQGEAYRLRLDRYFNEQHVDTIELGDVETLSPVEITKTSVKKDATVYAKPKEFSVTTNKPLSDADVTVFRVEGDKRTELDSTHSIDGSVIGIEADKQLPRSTDIVVELRDVVGVDGSTLLDETYELPFKMSGGPKVTGASVGATGIAQSEVIRISFDQPLSAEQDIASLVDVAGASATISHTDDYIDVQLQDADLCQEITITTDEAIKSRYDIDGSGKWSFTTRTTCYTTSTIGYTVNGAAIPAYSFGNGNSTALFVGLTHGNEQSTYQLMSSWIDELERDATSIPEGKRVVVVPGLNRDSLASASRTNANDVDLNRNFPTADWKRDVKMPSGNILKNGGGKTALSEPESQAIASFTQQLNPYIVLTYHSVGGFLSPNEAGQSAALAQTYSEQSGYWISPKGEDEGVFDYDTTGAYEDWLYEGPGIAAILIELGSHSYADTGTHFPAMWSMVR